MIESWICENCGRINAMTIEECECGKEKSLKPLRAWFRSMDHLEHWVSLINLHGGRVRIGKLDKEVIG